jgi:lipopolysaccharide/colanic/teichoic acid biosynthesis glycosyltransferase
MKYLFDRVGALVGLCCLWPVLMVVALLIRVKMPGGPVIFRQKRVGRHGRLFTMYKFRSMTVGHSGSSVSVAGESRITPLGAKLRRYKLDELPELWNVLKGDMSFVGPRPDVPGYADQLQGDSRRVLLLRPGITGPASLKYRDEEELLAHVQDVIDEKGEMINEKCGVIRSVQEYNDRVIYPDKVRINLYYLDHYSFVKDIQMILCTVLGKKMKYGEEEI